MDIIRLIKTILRQYKIIIVSAVFMAGLVFLFTMNISRQYESTASIYTGITTGTDLRSVTQGRGDMMSVYSSLDNLANIITSRETLKEVGLRLFALHLTLKRADLSIISPEHLKAIQDFIPPDIKNLAGETDSITYRNLSAIADSNPFLINIINSPQTPYYNTFTLSTVKLGRFRSSDIISLSYICDDPGVSQKTLEILIEVCIRNYRKIKEGQIDKVVAFYEDELRTAQEKLRHSEERQENFKKKHGVVNIDGQVGSALGDRDDILRQINREQEILYATEAGIKEIESRLGGQSQSFRNIDILEKRERLSRLTGQLNAAELSNASADRIASLQSQINQVKNELNRDISSSSASPAGGRNHEVAANEYFNKVVSYEESKARLKALQNRKDATMGQYTRFLPLGDSLNKFQREIGINEKAYFAALDLLNQCKKQQQDQRSFSTIEVIDKPNYPLTAKSKRTMLVMLGGAIGGIIPITIILGMAYFNRKMQTPQRAEQATGLKLGGIIPDTKMLQSYKSADQISDGLSDTILKNLYMSDHKSHQQRILVISTRPSEGKTTICNMLCDRLIRKGRKCLVVIPYLDSGSWSIVSYKVDNAFYQARAEDLVPVERLNDTDILILELPSLIMSDYPVALIKEFDMAFLVCDANREWTKADQTALDSFIKISGITPQIILNDVDLDVVEEVLGKISK